MTALMRPQTRNTDAPDAYRNTGAVCVASTSIGVTQLDAIRLAARHQDAVTAYGIYRASAGWFAAGVDSDAQGS